MGRKSREKKERRKERQRHGMTMDQLADQAFILSGGDKSMIEVTQPSYDATDITELILRARARIELRYEQDDTINKHTGEIARRGTP
jgi:type III secretory pathway component EscT